MLLWKISYSLIPTLLLLHTIQSNRIIPFPDNTTPLASTPWTLLQVIKLKAKLCNKSSCSLLFWCPYLPIRLIALLHQGINPTSCDLSLVVLWLVNNTVPLQFYNLPTKEEVWTNSISLILTRAFQFCLATAHPNSFLLFLPLLILYDVHQTLRSYNNDCPYFDERRFTIIKHKHWAKDNSPVVSERMIKSNVDA